MILIYDYDYSSADVASIVLSVYMCSKDRPLPTSTEILVCTPQTTEEQVSIQSLVYIYVNNIYVVWVYIR